MSVGKKTGFALRTPEERRELGSRGGKRAHKLGTAHEFSRAEAKRAGALGGKRAGEERAKRKKKKEGATDDDDSE